MKLFSGIIQAVKGNKIKYIFKSFRINQWIKNLLVFVMIIISLLISLFFSLKFFVLCALFILLHLLYSLYLKKYAVIDILSISFSFMIRAFAGEVVSGFHIPVW